MVIIKGGHKMSNIITINRQFGSGGREVGKRLADALQCSYYDKELLEIIAKEVGYTTEYINQFDESATRTYAYTFGRSFVTYQQTPADTIQLAYTNVIKSMAQKNDCVIMGRCANHSLRDQNPLKVFIYASDIDFKIARCFDKVPADKEFNTQKQMAKDILKVDKQRAKYHEYYTGQTWSDMSNYNLCIDTSKIGINKAVELILNALNNK